jgi:hypothetical protein
MSFAKTQAYGGHIVAVAQVAAGTLKGPDGSPVIACSVYAAPPADGRALYGVSESIAEGAFTRYIDASYAAGVRITADGRTVYAILPVTAAGVPTALGGFTPVLQTLSLSDNRVNENAPNGTVIGAILPATAGSTITIQAGSDARLAVSLISGVWYLVTTGAAIDYEAATQLTLTGLIETLAGATGSPKTSAPGNILVQNQNDTNPTAITFTPATGAVAGTRVYSNVVTVAGMGAGDTVPLGIAGDPSTLIHKNGSAGGVAPGTTFANGDTVQISVIASSTPSASVSGTAGLNTTVGTFTVTTAASAAATFTTYTPTLTRTSANGNKLAFKLTGLDLALIAAGDFVHFELAASLTPAKTGGLYTTLSQPAFEHFLTEEDIVRINENDGTLDIDLGLDGYDPQLGAQSAHCWIRRDDGTTTLISNDISDTVTQSVARFASAQTSITNVYMAYSADRLTVQGPPSVGAYNFARTRFATTKTSGYFDVTGTAATDSSPGLIMGIENGTTDFTDIRGSPPGDLDSAGYRYGMGIGWNGRELSGRATADHTTAFPATLTGPFKARFEWDRSGANGTHFIKGYDVNIATGVATLRVSLTGLTIPAGPWYAFVGSAHDIIIAADLTHYDT